jgi:hypothetical protein
VGKGAVVFEMKRPGLEANRLHFVPNLLQFIYVGRTVSAFLPQQNQRAYVCGHSSTEFKDYQIFCEKAVC